MAIEGIDSKTLKNMFIAGAKYLETKKKYVNELNVFPVPDGDTGTNMTLTILAASKELQNVDSNDMAKVAKAISSGSLRGARGNSGVILSQLFRGFTKEISNYETLDTVVLANAMEKGVETAYKAVMKPKEGTILTVAREAAEKAAMLAMDTDDILFALKETIDYAEEVLQKTPDMLPVLKQAGVVDAGGQGLLYILRGAYMYLVNDGDIDFSLELEGQDDMDVKLDLDDSFSDIKFGYCTEFIINTHNDVEGEREVQSIRRYLETIGDSIVAVADDDIIKIHVHTNDPGKALQKGLSFGDLVNIKIDNMREQHTTTVIGSHPTDQEEKIKVPEKRKENGFIVVSIGDGLSKIFTSLGADYIVEGGQTMNPSTDDVLKAIENVNADNVYILPNNKNIILAAEQAKDLVKDKNVIVIPSKTIPQGIIAMISFDNSSSTLENVEEMTSVLGDVSTGQLTFAVRDTSIDDKEISEGDILGIGDNKILAVEKEVELCAKELVNQLLDEDSELVTIYYGADVEENDAQILANYIEEKHDDCDVEIHYGGQPLYYYILSVE